MRFARAAFLALSLLSCGGNLKADYEAICNAEERSGAASVKEPAEKAVKIAQWLSGQLKTKEAKEFMARLATLEPSQKNQALSDEAAKHGVKPCPIADSTWPKEK